MGQGLDDTALLHLALGGDDALHDHQALHVGLERLAGILRIGRTSGSGRVMPAPNGSTSVPVPPTWPPSTPPSTPPTTPPTTPPSTPPSSLSTSSSVGSRLRLRLLLRRLLLGDLLGRHELLLHLLGLRLGGRRRRRRRGGGGGGAIAALKVTSISFSSTGGGRVESHSARANRPTWRTMEMTVPTPNRVLGADPRSRTESNMRDHS